MANGRILVSLVGLPLLVAACGGGGAASSGGGPSGGGGSGGAGGAGSSGLPCDVEAVLAAHCQSCHAEKPVYGAPMPLVTHADLVAPAKSDPSKKVYELVEARVHDAQKPMPQPPAPMLGAADLATIDTWVAAGAPAGSADGCGGGGAGGGSSGTGGGGSIACTPDVKLRAGSAYAMPKATTDQYMCFGIDVPVASKRHITAILPAIDNNVIVHHMLLYQAPTAESPTPTPCSNAGGFGWQLLSVWAPGGKGFELPPEAGMPLEGTTHYVIQVHYSNLMQLDGQKDLSGFDLCTTSELRPNDADIMAFGSMKFSIPAHGKTDITCKFKSPAGAPKITVFGAMPHMHKLGTTISSTLLPAAGGSTLIAERNPWSFDAQYWSDVDQLQISAGDTVATRCAWQNPGDTNVSFGETTSDEMCYVFATYYPRIVSQGWAWELPALGATCAPTP
jgi:hypothetical protein